MEHLKDPDGRRTSKENVLVAVIPDYLYSWLEMLARDATDRTGAGYSEGEVTRRILHAAWMCWVANAVEKPRGKTLTAPLFMGHLERKSAEFGSIIRPFPPDEPV